MLGQLRRRGVTELREAKMFNKADAQLKSFGEIIVFFCLNLALDASRVRFGGPGLKLSKLSCG
jgi:hypothetical protein